MMKLYLAGPMTGIPQFNFPQFQFWADALEDAGYDVVSPHRQDDPLVQAAAWVSVDGDASKLPPSMEGSDPILTAIKNVRDIAGCGGIALIDGWYKSSGTIHEMATAVRFRMPTAPVQMWCVIGSDKMEELL